MTSPWCFQIALRCAVLICLTTIGASAMRAGEDAVDPVTVFEVKSIQFTGEKYTDETFEYRLMRPPVVEQDKKYPLVIFLHGAGERGRDNKLQLLYFPTQMAQPEWREKFPCYLLAPQCRNDRKWVEVDWSNPNDPTMPESPSPQLQTVMSMIEKTLSEEQVDPSRVYLTGLSMGGFGSFDLAIRRPDWFAAVAPVCGAADPKKVGSIQKLPIWLIHGDQDAVVSVER
ncbi:MAG: alpha/beta hydrolase-fold protein, partial [Planctomycetota bacterium]